MVSYNVWCIWSCSKLTKMSDNNNYVLSSGVIFICSPLHAYNDNRCRLKMNLPPSKWTLLSYGWERTDLDYALSECPVSHLMNWSPAHLVHFLCKCVLRFLPPYFHFLLPFSGCLANSWYYCHYESVRQFPFLSLHPLLVSLEPHTSG